MYISVISVLYVGETQLSSLFLCIIKLVISKETKKIPQTTEKNLSETASEKNWKRKKNLERKIKIKHLD